VSREVLHGGVNRPRIDGKDGVAGSMRRSHWSSLVDWGPPHRCEHTSQGGASSATSTSFLGRRARAGRPHPVCPSRAPDVCWPHALDDLRPDRTGSDQVGAWVTSRSARWAAW